MRLLLQSARPTCPNPRRAGCGRPSLANSVLSTRRNAGVKLLTLPNCVSFTDAIPARSCRARYYRVFPRRSVDLLRAAPPTEVEDAVCHCGDSVREATAVDGRKVRFLQTCTGPARVSCSYVIRGGQVFVFVWGSSRGLMALYHFSCVEFLKRIMREWLCRGDLGQNQIVRVYDTIRV